MHNAGGEGGGEGAADVVKGDAAAQQEKLGGKLDADKGWD